MKRYRFIVIILLFGIFGCQKTKDEVIITGTLIGEIQGEIEYTSSENGACFWQFAKPLQIDSSGHFNLTLKIDNPVFFQLIIDSYAHSAIIVEPGKNYEIQFNNDVKNDQLTVNCVDVKAQTLYRSLPTVSPSNEVNKFKITRHSIPINILDSINTIKESEILEFKELLNKNEISEPFYKLVKTDRTCYYTTIQSSFAWELYSEAMQSGNENLMDEILIKWAGLFQNSPLNDPDMVSSFWFYPLATNLINFKIYKEKPSLIDSLGQIYNSQQSHSFNVALAKILFSGKSEEYFLARYLQDATNRITKDEELVTSIQEFKNNYPDSKYSPYMDAIEISMAKYLKIADNPFNDNIKFVDSDNFNTLKECVNLFKGRKVYVDIWASWCLPCRAEFKYSVNLKKLLDSNNVVLLFISIDSGQFEKMWTELIKYYNLEGFHIKANQQLDGDLRRIYNNNGTITIPWNILIDENGQIMELHASRPSQLGQLEKEIKMN